MPTECVAAVRGAAGLFVAVCLGVACDRAHQTAPDRAHDTRVAGPPGDKATRATDRTTGGLQEVEVHTRQGMVRVTFTPEGGAEWTLNMTSGGGIPGTDSVTEAEVGLKFYPGAVVERGSRRLSLMEAAPFLSSDETPSSEQPGQERLPAVAALATSDPLEKVAQFYKARYGEGNQVTKSPAGHGLTIVIASGDEGVNVVKVMRQPGMHLTRLIVRPFASASLPGETLFAARGGGDVTEIILVSVP